MNIVVPTIVLLDTGPLGLATNPKAEPEAIACRQWIRSLGVRGIRVVALEIADYEVRRELLRAQKIGGIGRLNALSARTSYLPLTTDAMRQAALFWAQARQKGQPTAGNRELDGDVILAAQAVTLGLPVGQVVIATDNIGHLSRYTLAKLWQDIP